MGFHHLACLLEVIAYKRQSLAGDYQWTLNVLFAPKLRSLMAIYFLHALLLDRFGAMLLTDCFIPILLWIGLLKLLGLPRKKRDCLLFTI